MAHARLHEVVAALLRLREIPVAGEEQEQIGAGAVPLAGLEDRLLARRDVAAVAVQEQDPAEAVREQVFDQVVDEVEVDPRAGRERAGVFEVVV